MGVCYKCVDSSGATKVLKVSKEQSDTSMKEEFTMLEMLRHPNVLQVYQYFSFGPWRAYEMDMMANGDLHEEIVRRGALPGQFTHSELAQWFSGILSGLSYMHAQNVLHRDIKPANILFDHGMRPILGDLGLAVKTAPLRHGPRTCCGTPGFMAPEVVAQLDYGTPADVWSVNRVMHTCLTGDPGCRRLCDIHRDHHLMQTPWIAVFLRRSGCFVPCERALADELRNLVCKYEEEEALSAAALVLGTCGDARASGKAALLRAGRLAERRIKREQQADVVDLEAGAIDRVVRNAQRKVRRKAAIAKQKKRCTQVVARRSLLLSMT